MKTGFAARLRQSGKKTNNHASALLAKAQIRLNVLTEIGAKDARVFDAFAGEGQLYRRVWHKAAGYVGCDLVWYRDDRKLFVADNKRVMRAIDLGQFNIFDFDAWGSPWEHVLILSGRRVVAKGERIGLLLTEGSSLKLRMGGLPLAMAQLSGLRSTMAGAARSPDFIIERALSELARRLACRVLRQWRARGKTGAKMIYLGLVLEGIGEK